MIRRWTCKTPKKETDEERRRSVGTTIVRHVQCDAASATSCARVCACISPLRLSLLAKSSRNTPSPCFVHCYRWRQRSADLRSSKARLLACSSMNGWMQPLCLCPCLPPPCAFGHPGLVVRLRLSRLHSKRLSLRHPTSIDRSGRLDQPRLRLASLSFLVLPSPSNLLSPVHAFVTTPAMSPPKVWLVTGSS